MSSIEFLASLDVSSLMLFFWYTILFQVPRFVIGALMTAVVLMFRREQPPVRCGLSVSVLLAGHNEENMLRATVDSIAEQTVIGELGSVEVIFVDDGSTDRTYELACQIQREGGLSSVFRLEQRGGRSAAVNLALQSCKGEIVVICDVGTTFDRDAFAELLSYFSDPTVGGVSCDLGVRNALASLITRHQAIEYAISISLGRCVSDAIGTLSIVSGGFGAFRREAIEQVGGEEVESGEDSDLTMKLRRSSWRIRFAFQARGLTSVPTTVAGYIAQRIRWDGVLISVWLRKYQGALNPFRSDFRLIHALAYIDIIAFEIIPALIFPFYLLYLWYYFDAFAITIIGAMLIGYFIMNVIGLGASAVIGTQIPLRLFLYLPLFTILQFTLDRAIRIVAIIMELVFSNTDVDSYIPRRILAQVEA